MSSAYFTPTSGLTNGQLQAAERRARELLSELVHTDPFNDQAWTYAVRRAIRTQRQMMLDVMAERGLGQL